MKMLFPIACFLFLLAETFLTWEKASSLDRYARDNTVAKCSETMRAPVSVAAVQDSTSQSEGCRNKREDDAEVGKKDQYDDASFDTFEFCNRLLRRPHVCCDSLHSGLSNPELLLRTPAPA
ncbi:BQ5605_C001g00091 [Microbotryum silenes-dioicae]|uniref:BQ5605_C001g00091 protein n=1 Tax=Microbotryum silenes-dioicae TaxID=796604 RepID=A0A2X0NZD1_9BASI|nr:BQ5605_C001g00091 [Microbotryum silenes-dioicae]